MKACRYGVEHEVGGCYEGMRNCTTEGGEEKGKKVNASINNTVPLLSISITTGVRAENFRCSIVSPVCRLLGYPELLGTTTKGQGSPERIRRARHHNVFGTIGVVWCISRQLLEGMVGLAECGPGCVCMVQETIPVSRWAVS